MTDRARPATDWLLILGFCGFLFFFGLNYFGLIGADEPRYAQIAHEMLEKLNLAHTFREELSAYVTPYLYGKPWLEKPALYYWRAMLVFRDFGVHDWVARLPSSSFALWSCLRICRSFRSNRSPHDSMCRR